MSMRTRVEWVFVENLNAHFSRRLDNAAIPSIFKSYFHMISLMQSIVVRLIAVTLLLIWFALVALIVIIFINEIWVEMNRFPKE